jgi:hypothetical protein
MNKILDLVINKDYAGFREAIIPMMKEITDAKLAERQKEYSTQLKNRGELSEARGFSDAQRGYREYFNDMLKKYKVKSPNQLSDDERKKFFDEIDKGWKGKNEKD